MAHPVLAKIALNIANSRKGRKFVAVWFICMTLGPLVVIGVPVLVLVLIVTASSGAQDISPSPPGSDCPEIEAANVTIADLSSEQLDNAQLIIDVGQEDEIPHYGWIVALATALQESNLRNLDHGDRDSVGLFQQRPSAGWGEREDILNPRFATRAFYGGRTSPHWRAPAGRADPPGLQDIANWQHLSVTEAAQAVQRSAYPNAYTKWEPLARDLVREIAGIGGGDCGTGEAMNCPITDLDVERGLTPDGLRVLRCLVENWPDITNYHGIGDRPSNADSDHTTGRAVDAMIPNWQTDDGNTYGWKVARWLQQHAHGLGIRYIIWDAKIWNRETGGQEWRDYDHPSGQTDPTSQHLDHIHVSVYGDRAGEDTGTGEITLPIRRGLYELTARFGQCGRLWDSCHTGLDFAAEEGTIVRAVADAEVVSAEVSGSYGFLVILRHDDDTESWYAHLRTLPYGDGLLVRVKPGDTVQAGEPIGEVGQTGNSTGPHLHLEIRPDGGVPVDPELWLSARGVDP